MDKNRICETGKAWQSQGSREAVQQVGVLLRQTPWPYPRHVWPRLLPVQLKAKAPAPFQKEVWPGSFPISVLSRPTASQAIPIHSLNIQSINCVLTLYWVLGNSTYILAGRSRKCKKIYIYMFTESKHNIT